MTYQTNDIAELENRQANYSLAFSLPKTANNCQILGFADIPDVVTDFPYRKHDCRLYSNSFTMVGEGSYLVLDRVTDLSFECQILSGIADVFDELKEIKLGDIDLGSIQWWMNAVADTDVQQHTNIYGLAEFSKDGENLSIGRDGYFYSRYAYPFAKLKDTVTAALDKCGYTLIDDVPQNNNTELLRIGSYQMADNSFDPLNGTGSASEIITVDYGEENAKPVSIRGNALFTSGRQPYFEYKTYNDINLIGYVQINSSASSNFYLEIYKNGAFFTNIESNFEEGLYKIRRKINLDMFDAGDEENHFFDLKAGKKIKMELKFRRYSEGAVLITYSTTTVIDKVRYTNPSEQEVPCGGLIPISKNLGFDTVFDLFKFYLQLYGLTPYIDNSEKVIYAYSFDILNNKNSRVKDWSSKLHSKDITQEFILKNYAQENYITLKENSNKYQQSGIFTVENDTLKRDSTLFELPVKSCAEVVRKERNVANIDDIEWDEENTGYKFDSKTPVCVSCYEGESVAVSVGYDSNLGANSYSANLPFIKSLDIQHIIDSYYDKLTNKMLKNARIIEADFLLNDQDIEEYINSTNGVPGCFIPIYLSQYGRYFYINKINNYQSNQLTRVELIAV